MNLQFIQRLYAATPLSERKVGESGSDLTAADERPSRRPRKRRPWLAFSVVDEARAMHEQQHMSPARISAAFAERGIDAPTDTVGDWVKYRTRRCS